jgi:hypothetical protein
LYPASWLSGVTHPTMELRLKTHSIYV